MKLLWLRRVTSASALRVLEGVNAKMIPDG